IWKRHAPITKTSCGHAASSSIAMYAKKLNSGWRSESMRVLHLVKTAVGATWALRQMRELVKLGVDVHVMLPSGPLVGKYHEAGITTHSFQADFPVRSLWRLPGLLTQFRDRVEAIAPD